mgnify:CR=1 FL=1|jgi:hypothetical protein
MANLTGVFNATGIAKGQDNTVTLSKSALETEVAALEQTPYFQDSINWKQVKGVYLTDEGKQINELIFDASLPSPTGNFNPTAQARNTWEIKAIIIFDFDGGFLKINRGDLTVGDFDILLGIIAPSVLNTVPGSIITTQNAIDLPGENFGGSIITNDAGAIPSGSQIHSIEVKLTRVGSPDGDVKMEIYSGSPTGTLLGTSDLIAVSSLVDAWNAALRPNIVFSFASPVVLPAEAQYYFKVVATGTSIDSLNKFSTASSNVADIVAPGQVVNDAYNPGNSLYSIINGVQG